MLDLLRCAAPRQTPPNAAPNIRRPGVRGGPAAAGGGRVLSPEYHNAPNNTAPGTAAAAAIFTPVPDMAIVNGIAGSAGPQIET